MDKHFDYLGQKVFAIASWRYGMYFIKILFWNVTLKGKFSMLHDYVIQYKKNLIYLENLLESRWSNVFLFYLFTVYTQISLTLVKGITFIYLLKNRISPYHIIFIIG